MKESNIDRIISPSEGEREKVGKIFKQTLESQALVSFQTERQKSPEELEIIKFLDRETDAIAKEFGGSGMQIIEKYIHIIKEDEFISYNKIKGVDRAVPNARFDLELQAIVIKDPTESTFFHNAAHEMLHMKSFQSERTNLEKEPGKAFVRRTGLVINAREDIKKGFFIDLNEAITEYLVSRLADKISANRDAVPDALKKGAETLGEREFKDKLYSPSYIQWQLSLMEIMDKIKEKNPEEYKSREDVLRVFGEAYFAGHLLKLQKVIDGAYGKGSFVEFAEEGLPKSKWEIEANKNRKNKE